MKAEKKSKSTEKKGKLKLTSTSERGVVYFSHLPHGFFEKEMREFLSQFGTVTNLRIGKQFFLQLDRCQKEHLSTISKSCIGSSYFAFF